MCWFSADNVADTHLAYVGEPFPDVHSHIKEFPDNAANELTLLCGLFLEMQTSQDTLRR